MAKVTSTSKATARIDQMFAELLSQPLPDALDALIWRGATNNADATPFERFAARQLVEAGAGEIRAIAAEHEIQLIKLTTTNMFWMRFDDDLEGLQRDVVLSVEAALNRLAFVHLDAREKDGGIGLMATADERFCYQSMMDAMHMVSQHAGFIDRRDKDENPLRTIHGVSATRGGNWDASTRFGAICERLMLPFRLEYRYDIDTVSGALAVRCGVPTAMMFPVTGYDFEAGHPIGLHDRRPAWAASYAMRLAGLLAMAAFKSSLNITDVTVSCHAGSINGDCVLSLQFDRTPFMMGVVPKLLGKELDEASLDDDPLEIYRMLSPRQYSLRFGAGRCLMPVEPLPMAPALAARRLPVWRDERLLPPDLQTLLRADRACELDVMKDNGAVKGSEVSEIISANEDSPLTASIELESVLLRLEDAERQAALAEGAVDGDESGELHDAQGRVIKPLYCEHPLMRLMVSLDGDDPDVRYRKIPDALFDARLLLGRLNREAGNKERALAEEEECARIAFTTAQPFIDLSMTYAEIDEDYEKAADALTRALAVAVMPVDIAFIYYRLAYALWQTGSLREALACYVKVLDYPSMSFCENARTEIRDLKASADGLEEPQSLEEAAQILRAAGIPVAPVHSAVTVLTKAAMGLVDAGFPRAADETVWFLGRLVEGDVLSSMAPSLRWGVGPEVTPTE